jgi:hypothetical protein
VTGELLLQAVGQRGDAVVALAGGRRVDQAAVLRPHARDELGAARGIGLAVRGEVAVDRAAWSVAVVVVSVMGRTMAAARPARR